MAGVSEGTSARGAGTPKWTKKCVLIFAHMKTNVPITTDAPRSKRKRLARVTKPKTQQRIEAESEQFLSRRQLAARWACSTETVKRKTRAGLLYPVRFNARMLRYRLTDILRIEAGK